MAGCKRCVVGKVMRREWQYVCTQSRFMLCIVCVPLLGAMFFTTMLQEGLPERVPIAVVDTDNSVASRRLVSSLSAQQSVSIVMKCNSYGEARRAMQRGEIYGFMLIPKYFQQQALDGKQPCITFYINDAYLVPGSLLYKSFKTVSLLTSAAVVQKVLMSVDIPQQRIETLLQPITIDLHPLGNPWVNYSVYLSNSFIPALLQLMVLLATIFALGREWKHRTVGEWLNTARDDVLSAVVGKLLVYTLLHVVVGVTVLWILYGFLHYPFHTRVWEVVVAMVLLVLAAQSVAVLLFSLFCNLLPVLSAVSVIGVVSFSLGGFSFPVSDMYTLFRPLSSLLPVRHYFLIYVNSVLNGYSLYYCRGEYVALLMFVVVGIISLPILIWRMKQYQGSES